MYTSFYNLTDKPFQLSPDPGFFFESKGHKRAMSYLRYGLTQAEGFIVITGEVGAGKTTVVRNLFRTLEHEKEKIVSSHLVSTQLDADDMLRTVAAGFGIEEEGGSKASVLKKLENFLRYSRREGKRVLLVVDEAQNLTPKAVEELRMLSNFQADDQPLLQSFLLGQPEFRNTLQGEDMLQLRQRVIASYHLGPLDETETRAYIEHRLNLAGWKNDPSFTDESFQAIFEYTKGIPRRVNTLCDRLMLFGFLEELHAFDQDLVKTVIQDISHEFSQPPAGETKTKSGKHAQKGGGDTLERLERKMDNIEKTINRLLTVVIRKVLVQPLERKSKEDN